MVAGTSLRMHTRFQILIPIDKIRLVVQVSFSVPIQQSAIIAMHPQSFILPPRSATWLGNFIRLNTLIVGTSVREHTKFQILISRDEVRWAMQVSFSVLMHFDFILSIVSSFDWVLDGNPPEHSWCQPMSPVMGFPTTSPHRRGIPDCGSFFNFFHVQNSSSSISQSQPSK